MSPRIDIKPENLLAESRRLSQAARDIEISINQAKHAYFGKSGLPGYARQTEGAIEDMRNHMNLLQLAAEALRARYVLACIASRGGGGALAKQLQFMENHDPDAALKTLMQAVASTFGSEGIKWGTEKSAAAIQQQLRSQYKLTGKQIAVAQAQLKTLRIDEFIRRYGMTPADFKGRLPAEMGLRGAVRGVGDMDSALNRTWLKKIGSGPANVGIDAIMQWFNDRHEDLDTGTRAGRVAVAAVFGVLAGAATAGVCAGTAGFGCPLAVGVGAGFIGNVMADATNKQFLPTDDDKFAKATKERIERQARELRKLDQWYIENAKPTHEWYDKRVEGGRVERVITSRGTSTSYYAPHAEQANKQKIEYPDGRVEIFYFDERGDRVYPK